MIGRTHEISKGGRVSYFGSGPRSGLLPKCFFPELNFSDVPRFSEKSKHGGEKAFGAGGLTGGSRPRTEIRSPLRVCFASTGFLFTLNFSPRAPLRGEMDNGGKIKTERVPNVSYVSSHHRSSQSLASERRQTRRRKLEFDPARHVAAVPTPHALNGAVSIER